MGKHSKENEKEKDVKNEFEELKEAEKISENDKKDRIKLNKKKEKKEKKSHKGLIAFIIIVILLGGGAAACYFLDKYNVIDLSVVKNLFKGNSETQVDEPKEELPPEIVDIVDLESTSRPFAVAINNHPDAVKVQTGLNDAYLVYEIATEGSTSRLLAFFKDKEGTKIGTVRSARLNFLDFCFEQDAVFCHFGHNSLAKQDITSTKINDIDGFVLSSNDETFWRENKENLAYEHRVFTTIDKLKEFATDKEWPLKNESAENVNLLKYNVGDVDLSTREDAIKADEISVPYGTGFNTRYEYDPETKEYKRYRDDAKGKNWNLVVDHETGEAFTAKNIIVEKVTYQVMNDEKHVWKLGTIGSGEGYFITNGYAVPIKWSKADRKSKTVYTYLDGTEIEVSDGRTYINVQTTSKELTIKENEVPVENTEATNENKAE